MAASDQQAARGLGPWLSGDVEGFVPFPDDALAGSIAQRFFEVAAQHPERTALSSPADTWTYGQLADLVGRRASALDSLMAGPASSVALMLEHDGPLVAMILAVATAGHVVVVLDPTAPAEMQRHVLAESGAEVIVHDAAHAEMAAALAEGEGRPSAVPAEGLDADPMEPVRQGSEAPMMLAFTSGTSGDPKAAVVTHSVVLNVVRGATNALGIDENDVMPMLFPLSLAVAAYPMFLPLLNGGCLATLDVRSVGLDPISSFLEREGVTLAYMAPTVIRFLVDATAGHTFPAMRMIALGGELVDAEVIDLTASMFAPDMIAVGYGTTESGVVSLHVQRADEQVTGTVPCGHAVPEVEIHILDDSGQPVETGEAGEIAIVGPHMFDGYRGHPETSASVLSDDPDGRPGWQLYRTGDFGHVDDAGELVVSGRVDTRVKVRGRMVVLGDVEADLLAMDAVRDAAVTARRTEGIVELVAHVVAEDGHDPDIVSIRSDLLERREPFCVPSWFVFLTDLPRLPNGKVDRRALDTAGPSTPGRNSTGEPGLLEGESQFQRVVRDLWEELLPAPLVGPDDDFMALGGDSLLAAQMLVELENRTGITVPMGELLHASTVRDLSARLVTIEQVGPGSASKAAMVQRGDGTTPRLWFLPDLQGSAYRVRHLAAALGTEREVWSFESPLLDGRRNDYPDLVAFGADLLGDLLAVQPEGPYCIAGYSFGGICAYEMARQLLQQGREVAFVGIVDVGPGYRGPGWHAHRSPFRPWFGVAKPPEPGATTLESAGHYAQMLRENPSRALRHAMVRTGLSRVIDPFRFRKDLRDRGRVRPEWRLWYAWEEHWKLAATQWDRSLPYPGAVDLFWANDTPSEDATMGWGPLVGELSIHRFDGDHEGILEPRGAASLAEVLARRLDELAS